MAESFSITPSSVVCWQADPLAADVGGRIVLMNPALGNYYDLDGIASDIWQRIAQPIRVDVLCGALVTAYEGDPSAIQRDVLTLLRRLAEHDLIAVRAD